MAGVTNFYTEIADGWPPNGSLENNFWLNAYFIVYLVTWKYITKVVNTNIGPQSYITPWPWTSKKVHNEKESQKTLWQKHILVVGKKSEKKSGKISDFWGLPLMNSNLKKKN